MARKDAANNPWMNRQYGGVEYNIPDTGGQIFWVNSNAQAGTGADDASHGYEPDAPFLTVDYAVGRCTANAGAVIVAMENHAETLTAAAGIDFDVAGITLWGLGNGANRPTFTFTTATAADIDVDAADTRIHNCVFVCNIASQVSMLDVSASGDGLKVTNCRFEEGSATGVTMILLGDADNVVIDGCEFYAATAGNYDECIHINAAVDNLRINNCDFRADCDDACIHNPTGNVATNLVITGNRVNNLLAGAHALELVSACTGIYDRNSFLSSAFATCVDPGSLVDGGHNSIGLNGADGGSGFSSVSGAFYPGLGYRVSATSGDVTAAADDIFSVTGKNFVTLVHGEVTTLIAGGTTPTAKLNMKTNSVDLCAATTVTDDAAGTLYLLTGDQDDAANGGDAPTVDHAQIGDGNGLAPIIVDGDTIEMTTTGTATAGVITWHLYYMPMEQGAEITAAA